MPEIVHIRQTRNYETTVMASVVKGEEAEAPFQVMNITDLSPYGMVLSGLGTCTSFVVNTYCEHHGIRIDAVSLTLEYNRSFKDDCEGCEEIDKFEEVIEMTVGFEGNLTEAQRDKLFKISRHCSVHKTLKKGIAVHSKPA